MKQRELKVLLYQDAHAWLAQCLEYDIAAQEESPEKVIEAFKWVFWSHIVLDFKKGREPLSTVPEAPREFWDRWDKATPLLTSCALPVMPPVEEHIRLLSPDREISAAL